jgi:hypothetical protein
VPGFQHHTMQVTTPLKCQKAVSQQTKRVLRSQFQQNRNVLQNLPSSPSTRHMAYFKSPTLLNNSFRSHIRWMIKTDERKNDLQTKTEREPLLGKIRMSKGIPSPIFFESKKSISYLEEMIHVFVLIF